LIRPLADSRLQPCSIADPSSSTYHRAGNMPPDPWPYTLSPGLAAIRRNRGSRPCPSPSRCRRQSSRLRRRDTLTRRQAKFRAPRSNWPASSECRCQTADRSKRQTADRHRLRRRRQDHPSRTIQRPGDCRPLTCSKPGPCRHRCRHQSSTPPSAGRYRKLHFRPSGRSTPDRYRCMNHQGSTVLPGGTGRDAIHRCSNLRTAASRRR